jgi:F-type H+-transporting ATPase subunit delta
MSANTTIARPYARAIFDIAKNDNTFDKWDNILSYLSVILEEKIAIDFIKNKTISCDDKALIINALLKVTHVLDNKVEILCKNFIQVLAYYNRLLYIKEIKNLYTKHVNIQLERIEALIETAYDINNDQKDEIILCLSKKFDKKISALFNVNDTLLGGFLIRIGDFVLDASIAGNIISLRNKIII